ncbi:hypothetical protein [Tumebacillus flagellatus]|uniref:Uncharacterized protein n=1 Tax=Tumebacillus flagellatus TaxID=1157490 RepID=A0A074LUK3_9BACL|nr:hypothetical protein [Tumebacillus flagellatus]KEO84280.1 hypothetical protein EL26_05805 [Tumebacillus flagellatus]
MANFDFDQYPALGLTAISRAGRVNFFDGHVGAAMLAAFFIQRDQEVPEHVREGLSRICEGYQAEHPEWFELFPEEQADPALLAHVVAGIRNNASVLRRSGHGVTFGTLALRALIEFPQLCTPSIVEGLAICLEQTLKDRANRYYGISDYLNLTPEELGLEPYADVDEMVQRAFDELDVVVPDGVYNEQFYFFTGELEHGVTFAQALVDLGRLGYEDIQREGMRWHRLQMHLNAQRPAEVLERQIVESGFTSVLDPAYWSHSYEDPHAIKVPYAALELLPRVQNRAEAERGVCKILTQAK